MDAIMFLRRMHADARIQLKNILASDDRAAGERMWQQLQPVLELHEELEDTLLYIPLANEMGPGTPLGDWAHRHDSDVATVKELIAAVQAADAGSPRWRMAVGHLADALERHVTDEEGQIFGRIEQVWDPERLASVGAQMEAAVGKAGAQPGRAAAAHGGHPRATVAASSGTRRQGGAR